MGNSELYKQIQEDIRNTLSKYEFTQIDSEQYKQYLKECIYNNIYNILESVDLASSHNIEVSINENNEGLVNIEPKLSYVLIEGKLEL